MAFWNFVVYRKSELSNVDFNGTIVTNASVTPIYITIKDNDDWLGGTPEPLQIADATRVPG